jgi:hypothetical protein
MMAPRIRTLPLFGLLGRTLPRALLALGILGACQSGSTEVEGLATITVSPEFASVQAGATQQFVAVAWDDGGNPLEGVTFNWKSSDSDVAKVNSSGLATAIGGGTAEIGASASGVRGSSQLSVSDAALLFSDGFETGNGSYTENGFKWNGGGGRVSVTKEKPHTGTYSVRFVFGPNPPGEDDWSELRFDMGAIQNELWIEYYLFVPENYEHRMDGVSHNKFLALWGSKQYSAPDQLQLFISTWPAGKAGWQSAAFIAAWADEDEVQAPEELFNFIGDAHRGSWIRVRYHIKPASTRTARDGDIEMWRDDTKIMSYNAVGWFHSVENGFRNGYLMGWSSSGFAEETKIYLDDFKVFIQDPGG